ncbi:hypothetical protein U1Q18_036979 [Sarracenia purpurea var. burkii]
MGHIVGLAGPITRSLGRHRSCLECPSLHMFAPFPISCKHMEGWAPQATAVAAEAPSDGGGCRGGNGVHP